MKSKSSYLDKTLLALALALGMGLTAAPAFATPEEDGERIPVMVVSPSALSTTLVSSMELVSRPGERIGVTPTGSIVLKKLSRNYAAPKTVEMAELTFSSAYVNTSLADKANIYTITNMRGGTLTNLPGNVVVFKDNTTGGPEVQWRVQDAGGSHYKLVNIQSGLPLVGLPGGVLFTMAGSNDDKWRLPGFSAQTVMKAGVPFPQVQCVSNPVGTGIVTRVKWYDPAKVSYTPSPNGEDNINTPDVDESLGALDLGWEHPLKEEAIAVGQQSCMASMLPNQQPRIAVLSVVGGKYASQAVGVLAGAAVGAVGGVACVGMAGTTCPLVAGAVSGLISGTISLTNIGIPDAKEIFYVGVPAFVETGGTAFNPSAEETGALR